MPDRPSKLAHVNFLFFYECSATPEWVRIFCCNQQRVAAKGAVNGEPERFAPGERPSARWGAATEAAMSRRLVWIEQTVFGALVAQNVAGGSKVLESPPAQLSMK